MRPAAPAEPREQHAAKGPRRPATPARRSTDSGGERVRLLLPGLAEFAATAWCSKRIVAICTDQRDASVSFAIANHAPHPVTVTLALHLENMAIEGDAPLTVTLAPSVAREIAVVRAVDRSIPFRWSFAFDWVPGSSEAQHHDHFAYELPFPQGTASRVLQGPHGSFSHVGECEHAIDFDMAEGATVTAARGGHVVGTRSDSTRGGANRQLAEHANYVLVRHEDDTLAEYMHLRTDGVLVAVGDEVRAGQPLGLAGNTGFSTGPHLHFMVYKARDGRQRESVPVRFRLDGGVSALEEGRVYPAPDRSGRHPAGPAPARSGHTSGTSTIAIR